MKKSLFLALFLAFILNFAVTFRANGYSDFIFSSQKEINLARDFEVQTLLCSFSEHEVKQYNGSAQSEEQSRRIEETEPIRNLSRILSSKPDSVRILENIEFQRTRTVAAQSEKNHDNNISASESEQRSALSKNKSRHTETRQNIPQRK